MSGGDKGREQPSSSHKLPPASSSPPPSLPLAPTAHPRPKSSFQSSQPRKEEKKVIQLPEVQPPALEEYDSALELMEKVGLLSLCVSQKFSPNLYSAHRSDRYQKSQRKSQNQVVFGHQKCEKQSGQNGQRIWNEGPRDGAKSVQQTGQSLFDGKHRRRQRRDATVRNTRNGQTVPEIGDRLATEKRDERHEEEMSEWVEKLLYAQVYWQNVFI